MVRPGEPSVERSAGGFRRSRASTKRIRARTDRPETESGQILNHEMRFGIPSMNRDTIRKSCRETTFSRFIHDGYEPNLCRPLHHQLRSQSNPDIAPLLSAGEHNDHMAIEREMASHMPITRGRADSITKTAFKFLSHLVYSSALCFSRSPRPFARPTGLKSDFCARP
jgi:hypothetical protein